MRVKLPRQTQHRSKNTYTFQGFREKVRLLRVSARNYLLQRPIGDDGSTITNFHQTLIDSRDLNLTQGFQVSEWVSEVMNNILNYWNAAIFFLCSSRAYKKILTIIYLWFMICDFEQL